MFAIGGEQAARRAVDVLTEVFFEGQAAIAAFERPDGRWDITVHFAAPPNQALVSELVTGAAGAEAARTIAFDTVEAKDWVKASLEDLVPVPAGRFVVHGRHDRDRIAASKLGIEIEAALAFGTGHHGTTRGCLIALDELLTERRFERVLDLGSGTGVLAIAVALAQKSPVLATDIDETSARIAGENAVANGAGDYVTSIHAESFDHPAFVERGPFNLIVANILAGPLVQLAGDVRAHLADGGVVVLSGLMTHEEPTVRDAYLAQGLTLVSARQLDGWSTLVLKR